MALREEAAVGFKPQLCSVAMASAQGPMAGVQLCSNGRPKRPNANTIRAVLGAAVDRDRELREEDYRAFLQTVEGSAG